MPMLLYNRPLPPAHDGAQESQRDQRQCAQRTQEPKDPGQVPAWINAVFVFKESKVRRIDTTDSYRNLMR